MPNLLRLPRLLAATVAAASAPAHRIFLAVLLAVCAIQLAATSTPVHAQTMTTIAGTGNHGFSGDGGPATQADIGSPTGFAMNSAGDYFFSDTDNHRIRKVTAAGVISTYAGNGTPGFGGDGGQAVNASLHFPQGLALDNAGNLYIADQANSRIRRVTLSGVISTYVGTGTAGFSGDDGPAASAQISQVSYLIVDSSQRLVFSDTGNHRVRRVTAAGIVSTIAGNGTAGFSGDGGQATSAQLNSPAGVTTNGGTDVIIADMVNHRVRRINASGVITTVIGNGNEGYGGDNGPPLSATLSFPLSVTYDSSTANIIFVDSNNSRIRRSNGSTIYTIAGNGAQDNAGSPASSINGPINSPGAVVRAGGLGTFYFTERDGNRVRKLVMTGNPPTITSLLPGVNSLRVGFTPTTTGTLLLITNYTATCTPPAGPGVSATGLSPLTVAGLTPNTLYLCRVVSNNQFGASVPSVEQALVVPTPAVADVTGPASSITTSVVTFNATITGVPDVTGTVAFTQNGTNIPGCAAVPIVSSGAAGTAACVTNALPAGTLSIRASYPGNATNSPADSIVFTHEVAAAVTQAITFDALPARLSNAAAFAIGATGGASGNPVTFVSRTGKVCVTTGTNGTTVKLTGIVGTCTIRASQTGTAPYLAAPNVDRSFVVNPSVAGVPLIATLAGTGASGFGPDGTFGALTAIANPNALVVDAGGNVIFIDRGNHRVRKIETDGTIATVAGDGTSGFQGDGGPATAARINFPAALALDPDGNLFIADTGNHRVRKVDAAGIITTVAGTGTATFSGDGGFATAAGLNQPAGLAFDASGNLYIADRLNNRVRRVSSGFISTFMGTGSGTFGGDGGPATAAGTSQPTSVAVDGWGNVYVADRQVSAGRVRRVDLGGIVNTVAGGGATTGLAGDGLMALTAQFSTTIAVAVDAQNNLLIAETGGRAVRRVVPSGRIYSVTGNGNLGLSADGVQAWNASSSTIQAVAVDLAGDVYVAEFDGHRIRKISYPPASVPQAVSFSTQTAGDTQITLAFRPAYPGGGDIVDYTVTCGAETRVVTAPGQQVFTGLTNGTGYTCTVVARNEFGSSAVASTAVLRPRFVTTTTVTGPAASAQGAPTTFGMTVAGSNPTGFVTFRDGGVAIAGCSSLPLVNGTVNCTTTALPLGARQISAAYSGDNFNSPSNSTALNHTVSVPVAPRRFDAGGDGKSDVIWYHSGVFGVIGMNANGLSLDPYYIIDVQSDANWRIAGMGDLNGDGKVDLVWYNAATGELYGLLLDSGTVLAEGRIHLEPNLDWKPEQIADTNGDGRADIVWRNQVSGDVFVMRLDGLQQLSGQVVYSEPNLNWKIVASGDLNGDARADLLWRNTATGDVFAMLMNGFTVLSGGVIYTEPDLAWTIVGLADFNNDGRADVLWRNITTGDVFEMQMNGTVVSAGQVIYGEPNADWKIVALGDYNGDGRADLLWQNTVTGQVYMMLMDGFTVTGSAFVYTEPDTLWRIVGP